MPKSRKANSTAGALPSPSKCVGVTVLKKARRYSMFELLEVSVEGAFLGGKLLLEPGEIVTLELAFDDDRTTELEARVVSAETGDRPGIRVAWSSLTASDRALLAK